MTDDEQRMGGAFSVRMRGVGVTDVKSGCFLFRGLPETSVIMGRLHGFLLFPSSSDAAWGRGGGATISLLTI